MSTILGEGFKQARDSIPARSFNKTSITKKVIITTPGSIHNEEKELSLPELPQRTFECTPLSSAIEKHRKATLDQVNRLSQFSDEMTKSHERRQVINAQRDGFEERRVNFKQFILDNVTKMRRQDYAIKENKRVQELGKVELSHISQATEKALKRRELLKKKLTHLKVYENFVEEALNLLPKNYIRSNANASDSLVARFVVLYEMKAVLLKELYKKQETIERESQELVATRLCSTENLLTKSSELQQAGNLWRKDKENLQQYMELYERDKDRATEECIRFFTVIRALRNIAEKAANGLGSIQTHAIGSQQKATLQMNFRLILKFLSMAVSIRDEITQTNKKLRASSANESTKTHALSTVSHLSASTELSSRDGPRATKIKALAPGQNTPST